MAKNDARQNCMDKIGNLWKMLDKIGQVLDEGPVDCHLWLHQLKKEFVNLRAGGVWGYLEVAQEKLHRSCNTGRKTCYRQERRYSGKLVTMITGNVTQNKLLQITNDKGLTVCLFLVKKWIRDITRVKNCY